MLNVNDSKELTEEEKRGCFLYSVLYFVLCYPLNWCVITYGVKPSFPKESTDSWTFLFMLSPITLPIDIFFTFIGLLGKLADKVGHLLF